MSPEQVRGRVVDHLSDIWSLGVVLFECITGQLPFPGDDVGDVLVEVCSDPIPTPSEVCPDLGPAIDQFFQRALARDRMQRFQSARELADALAALTQAEGLTWSGVHPAAPVSARGHMVSDAVAGVAALPPLTPSVGVVGGPAAQPGPWGATPPPSAGAPGREIRTAPGLSSSVDTAHFRAQVGRSRLAKAVLAGAGSLLAVGLAVFLLLRPSSGADTSTAEGASSPPLASSDTNATSAALTTASAAPTEAPVAATPAPTETPKVTGKNRGTRAPARPPARPAAGGRPREPGNDHVFGF
jgi:serine/threonine-protein kinase